MHFKIILANVCVVLLAHSTSAFAQGTATLSLGNVSAPVGSVVAMPLLLDEASTDISSLVLNLSFNAEELSVVEVALEANVSNAGKALQHRTQPGELGMSIFGGVAPYPIAKIGTIYWKINAQVNSGTTITIANADSSAANPAAEPVGVQINGGKIEVTALGGHHSADYQQDFSFSLSELLRVIQFFNSPALHCSPGSEDGYSPGAGDTSCNHHSSDYNLSDWKINLSELLRTIQFYNSIGSAYHPDAGGEDDFAPGPFGE